MADTTEIIIGPADVEYNGVKMGYTSEDGVSIATETTNTEFTPSQSIGIPAVHRSRVRTTATATFHQLTLEKIALIQGFSTSPTGTDPRVLEAIISPRVDQYPLVITAPGPNKSVRVYVANASITSPGSLNHSNEEFAGVETEFLLHADPVTDRIYTLYEYPAAVTVPEVDTFQRIDPNSGTPTTIVDGATAVPVNSHLQFTWNTGIRADQVGKERFYIRNRDTGLLIATTVTYGTTAGNYDYVKVKVAPVSALSAATDYELVAVPYIRSFSGAQSDNAYVLGFTTA